MREQAIAKQHSKLAVRQQRSTVYLAVQIGALIVACAAASLYASPSLPGALGTGLALLMVAIAAVDARHFLIPNELTAAALVLALVNAAVRDPGIAIESIALATLRGAALALLFLALRGLYLRLRGREGLGLGDVKLAGVAGAWLDWWTLPIAIEIAALGALGFYGWRYYVRGRPVRATSRIPFGMFFAPAIWIGWLLEALLARV
jgi:leader peptidase (prepilin peptidase)/N-methyltransferase